MFTRPLRRSENWTDGFQYSYSAQDGPIRQYRNPTRCGILPTNALVAVNRHAREGFYSEDSLHAAQLQDSW